MILGRVHIVGAGLAGLAAAVALAERGVAVEILEAAPHAGGRCRSYFEPALGQTIDNGNHLVLSGNEAVARYVRIIGAEAALQGPDHAQFAFADLVSGARWTIRPNDGAIPWWLLSSARRVPGAGFSEYIRLGRLVRAGAGTVASVYPRRGALWERLIRPVLLAALNTRPEDASAKLAGRVLSETLAQGGRACRPRIAHPTLAAAFVDPALAYLEKRGARIHFSRRLTEIVFGGGRAAALASAQGQTAVAQPDAVILAVPPWAARSLLPGITAPDSFRAIVNGHFALSPPARAPRMMAALGGTAEWIFALPGRISVTVSDADRLVEMDRAELADLLWRDVRKAYGIEDPLPPWQIVKEKRATFAATPEQESLRPSAATRWENLFLAGDWTDTGLPATIEGAIRSGYRAAQLVLERAGTPKMTLDETIRAASAALFARQQADGHWVFELEADATIPAEYVLLVHYLGEAPDLTLERKIGVYLRRNQAAHDGWPLFHGGAFDISASVKAYFALKMIGDAPDAPHMARARAAILARGGAGHANVFTRFLLALYGETPWRNVPSVPVEMILLPRWFPVHISKMSYWARTVLVPLLVLQALKPVARNPRRVRIGELFAAEHGPLPRAGHQNRFWAGFFGAVDHVLKRCDSLWPKRLRRRAIDSCAAFVVERLNGEDGLGAIYPAMANSVMMFDALGFPEHHPHRATARAAIDRLLVVKEEEAYCQPCVSPVWDTALAAHALMEAGADTMHQRVEHALAWLMPRQVLDVKGDWAESRPAIRPGGWAFQYNNAHYPDLDDTAVVVMALDRLKPSSIPQPARDEAIARGLEWVAGLQSRNGGWGAFDADNTYDYLNNIPFADHGALLDPPTADVSARCVGMLAQLGSGMDDPRLKAGVEYLLRVQEKDGSWFGRWGVNYIYGTWSVLAALNAAASGPGDAAMRKAADWLLAIQNPDGGWGEDCDSYRLDYQGYSPAPSTASQTAWALLGLMAAGEADHPAVARGIAHLEATQGPDGTWEQAPYTGGGFPRVFYLRYHGYPLVFPLWALARYRNLKSGNIRRVAFGL